MARLLTNRLRVAGVALLFFVDLLFTSSLRATPMSDGSLEQNSKFLDAKTLKFIQDLLAIPTGSKLISEQQAARNRIIQEFADLNITPRIIDGDQSRKILVFDRDQKPGKILLIGHIDTVFGNQASEMSLKDGKISGLGVIDMKGGIALIHKVLQEISRSPGTDALENIRVVLNDDEEIGSPGSRVVLKQLAQDAKAILIYEPGLPGGSVITAQAGVQWLKLTVHGRAAHAGLEPENGLNACLELAHKIIKIAKLNQYSRHLTVNPGVIEGGSVPNTVCEKASVIIDVRYLNPSDLDGVVKKISTIQNTHSIHNRVLNIAPTADVTTLVSLPPLPEQSSTRLFGELVNAGNSIHQSIRSEAVGYASDGNHLASLGYPILVGLGPFGGGMHTASEFMTVESFDQRVELSAALLKRLLGQTLPVPQTQKR